MKEQHTLPGNLRWLAGKTKNDPAMAEVLRLVAKELEQQQQALTQAREALEECANESCAVVHWDGIGNDSREDAPVNGCDCWACERTRRVRAALAALEGRAQP